MKALKCGGKMYVLLVYDIGEKRVAKALKFLRKYLKDEYVVNTKEISIQK